MNVIELLKGLRTRKRWTQVQAAKAIGVRVRTLRSWEQGTRHPKPIVERALALFDVQNP